ncbi:MAG: N-acetylmuramoyl-L-alanine amidase, partial [Clostridia bacterium]|nr:N-acetylmuramoyl-L-alanine amidase [Clostridia bacterium]
MPTVYLSPSTQEYNEYYDKSGSEEYYMNLIADAMVPLLEQRGITVNRNSPNMTASQSAAQSASGENGLHLAIHSNAAGVGNAGNVRGVDVYHYAPSREGKRAAEIIARDMRNIYPDPALVRVLGNTAFVELRRTKAPAVLIEVGYHDNPADAEWIK